MVSNSSTHLQAPFRTQIKQQAHIAWFYACPEEAVDVFMRDLSHLREAKIISNLNLKTDYQFHLHHVTLIQEHRVFLDFLDLNRLHFVNADVSD